MVDVIASGRDTSQRVCCDIDDGRDKGACTPKFFCTILTVVNLFNLLLIVRLKPNETSARRLDKWLVMDRVWIEYVIFKSIDEQ